MRTLLPFFPRQVNAVVSPSTVSASVSIEPELKAVQFTNSGLNLCYVKLGKAPLVATNADTPILPGESILLGKDTDDDTCAYIGVGDTVLNIKEGEIGEEVK